MTLPGHIFPRQMASAALIPPKAYPGPGASPSSLTWLPILCSLCEKDKPHASALSAAEASNLLNAGLGIMLVQYVESESAWTPTAKKGATNGGVAASEAERLGVPWGVTIWCDLEGVAVGTPRQQVIDYCNRWHSAVSGAGYVPGLYVGYHSGLTATQLYAKLRFTHILGRVQSQLQTKLRPCVGFR